ncbi:MAG TPA: hypothetical protein DCX00_05520 [Flavobacteriales bacterium]|nr:hypothetical protein [Flavobacteriales bacterium]
MNNSSYNETLIQLEQNLKDLASARNQVLSVANQGEAIVTAFAKVLKSLDDFLATASFDQTSFEDSIQQRFNEANESFKKFNAGLESQLNELGKGRENANNAVNEAMLEEAKKVTEAVLSFNASIEQKKESFGDFLTNLQESISKNEKKVIRQFSSLEKEVKGTTEQLANLDLTTQLEATENRLKETLDQLQIKTLTEITTLNEIFDSTHKSFQSSLAQNRKDVKAALKSLDQTESQKRLEEKLDKMSYKQTLVFIGVILSAALSLASFLM